MGGPSEGSRNEDDQGRFVKIVVTGGAGFIGSAVCRHLVRETDAQVVNVDKLTYAANLRSLEPIANSPRYTFIRADICDRDAMDAVFARHAPDAVMHLAAESHVDRSINGSDAFIHTNVVGTHMPARGGARLLDAPARASARRRFRFLHVSTDEVYGSLGPDGAFSETTPYDPSSPYSASKAAADHLVGAWHRTYGLPVVISNCSNNYGPYHFPEKLIPLMILNALGGQAAARLRRRLQRARLALRRGPRARPAPDPRRGPTRREIQRRRPQRADQPRGGRGDLRHARPAGAGRARRGAASSPSCRTGPATTTATPSTPAKLERELGWRAEHDFDSGLAKTVRWYLDNRAWWEPLRKGVYAGERLGLIKAAE